MRIKPDGKKDKRLSLSDDDVRVIRKSDRKLRELAELFGVTLSHIWQIKAQRARQDVPYDS